MLPPLEDGTREFWTAGRDGELRLPYCDACARWVFPPALQCPDCDGAAAYRSLSGRGSVFTFTVNHHAFNPEVPVPYVIAIVELAEQNGLRFTTNLVNCTPEQVTVGMPVRVLFDEQDGVYVPVFEPDPTR
jgi:uncharacterized protein